MTFPARLAILIFLMTALFATVCAPLMEAVQDVHRRAGVADPAVPPVFHDGTQAALAEGLASALPGTRAGQIQWIARRLVPAGEPPSPETRLRPALACLRLRTADTGAPHTLPLRPLSLDRDSIFPSPAPDGSYAALAAGLAADLARLPAAGAHPRPALFSLLQVLRKHLFAVPASAQADVSLFDVSQARAALAACLDAGLGDAEIAALGQGLTQKRPPTRPIAAVLRGDLSGIQDFIYRVTSLSADATYKNTARRLRGRSFSLVLIGELCAQFLLRHLDLPACNLLFCSGGRFDLLIPCGSEDRVREAKSRIEDFLFHHLRGELSLQLAVAPLSVPEISDLGRCYRSLDQQLNQAKRRRWHDRLAKEDLYLPETGAEHHACLSCHSVPLPSPGVCRRCQHHDRLGRRLLKATHLAILFSAEPAGPPDVEWFAGAGKYLSLCAAPLTREQADALRASWGDAATTPELLLLSLNDTDFLKEAPASVGQGFRFLANRSPHATRELSLPGLEPVGREDVLPFEGIAHLGRGAELLGVLKADVDHLGLLLGSGGPASGRQTLAGLSAQSFAVDLFFCGWLNHLCDQLSAGWRAAQAARQAAGAPAHEWRDGLAGIFYTLYAGGDDLLLVGPWDGVMDLAAVLRGDFAAYTCHNPNVTLSAGLVLVKPRYPVHRFADAVGEALEQAKGEGRDRISLFRQALPWSETLRPTGYEQLLSLGRELLQRLEEGEDGRRLPRTLLHDLVRLARAARPRPDGARKPIWHHRLYYTLARRMDPRDADVVGRQVLALMPEFQRILIPVSYASYATRKEG